ncbi:ATP-binding protein [Aliikangiella maris]|uniref:histidine kinase n=2 Tax=Aliikangiella maris TaxID=3162458 RepID=A0ABV2BU38_9GAMM
MKNLFKLLASFKLASCFFILFSTFTFVNASSDSSQKVTPPSQNEINGQWYAVQVKKYARNAPNIALKFAEQSVDYFAKKPDPLSEARVLNESSYAYYFLGNNQKAMELAKKSEVLAKKHNLGSAIARSKVLQGNVMQSIGVFKDSLVLYKDAATYYRETQNIKQLGKVLVNLANTYFEAGQYSIAMDFYQQAEEADVAQDNRAKYYLGYANTYAKQDDIDKSILYYLKATEAYAKDNDQIGKELSQSGLGSLYLKQNRPDKALLLFDTALNSARASGRLFREVIMLCWKSEALIQLNRADEAFVIASEALDLATKLGTKADQITAYQAKAVSLEHVNRLAEAVEMYKQIITLDAEVRTQKVETQMAVMQILFDLEKKNHQIDLLSSQNTIQELNLKQQRALSLAIVVSILLLSISTFFFYYRRTQKKLLEEEQLISDRLKELDNLKNQVMANTSHELRTPLNGIIGMTQLLLETSETLHEEDAEKIEIIEQCGTRLLSLVQDITDFSQLQSGKLKITQTPVDLYKIALEVTSLLQQLAQNKSLELVLSFEEKLPLIYADKKRLHQVLLNLIGNSIKFSSNGQIDITAHTEKNHVRISVSDQGIGIPEDKLAQIFEPFEQVDGSATRQNEGSGLGLPITRELLLLHKSDITVITTLGKGTTFTFSLPIAEETRA